MSNELYIEPKEPSDAGKTMRKTRCQRKGESAVTITTEDYV